MITHNYRKLQIWNRSMDLAEAVYKEVAKFPTEEKYGLVSQLRRSVVSIPSNIAEGTGRGSDAQMKQFLEYAMGSCNEVQTQLALAARFNYLEKKASDELIEEGFQLFKMILGFYNKLK